MIPMGLALLLTAEKKGGGEKKKKEGTGRHHGDSLKQRVGGPKYPNLVPGTKENKKEKAAANRFSY